MFEITPYAHDHFMRSYDPFRAMEELEKNVFGHQAPAFKTDIRETDDAYILDAELPGFAKEDIHAEVKNGYLTIRAEHSSSSESKDEKTNYIRRERSYGSYVRRFDLDGINADDITAAYKDGVLTLTLPKAQTSPDEGRSLEIQ